MLRENLFSILAAGLGFGNDSEMLMRCVGAPKKADNKPTMIHGAIRVKVGQRFLSGRLKIRKKNKREK